MTKTKKTLYEILGVKTTANSAEIKIAYKALIKGLEAKQTSVDVDEAQLEKKSIDMAYSVLTNKVSRDMYDAKLLASQTIAVTESKADVDVIAKPSSLRLVLIGIAGLMLILLLMQLMITFNQNSQKDDAERIKKAAEELKIQEYYEIHGIRPASGAEVDQLLALERERKAEDIEREQERYVREQEYQQWLEENEEMSEELDRQWLRVEQEELALEKALQD